MVDGEEVILLVILKSSLGSCDQEDGQLLSDELRRRTEAIYVSSWISTASEWVSD